MTSTIHASPGQHVLDVLAEAVQLANETGEAVAVDFNGMSFEANPGDSFDQAKTRAEKVMGGPMLTRKEMAEKATADMEEREAAYEKARSEAGAATESEMRGAIVPRLESEDALIKYVRALVNRPHDYGTCVYAVSMAATAAFRYVAGELGITGFQAGCADMDILRRTRHMKDGFRIIDYGNLLYPQYWDDERTPIFRKQLEENRGHWAQKAAERLTDMSEHGSDHVRDHLRRLTDPDTSPHVIARMAV